MLGIYHMDFKDKTRDILSSSHWCTRVSTTFYNVKSRSPCITEVTFVVFKKKEMVLPKCEFTVIFLLIYF